MTQLIRLLLKVTLHSTNIVGYYYLSIKARALAYNLPSPAATRSVCAAEKKTQVKSKISGDPFTNNPNNQDKKQVKGLTCRWKSEGWDTHREEVGGPGRRGTGLWLLLIAVPIQGGSNHSEALCVYCVCTRVRTILILPQPLGIALSSAERRLACALALVYN